MKRYTWEIFAKGRRLAWAEHQDEFDVMCSEISERVIYRSDGGDPRDLIFIVTEETNATV